MIELRPASAFDDTALAATFTAGYRGYLIPIELDADAFAAMAGVTDADRDRSLVACSDGAPVGVVLLGVRDDRGWIGGLGVEPDARRDGVGRQLMLEALAVARAAGLREVSLEVLEANDAARRLYDSLGFETRRLLEIWTLETAETGRAEAADLETARATIARRRRSPEPWQRADETVDRMLARGSELAAVALGERGACVFRRSGDSVGVLQLAADGPETARELLLAARGDATTLRFVNVPEGDPASVALAGLGGRIDLRQLEQTIQL